MQRPQQNPGNPSTPRLGGVGAPPLFSPTFSCSESPAAASAAVVSEHPSVTLSEWWLARVEGHERKIAVAGFFERNQALLDFPAASIAKRHECYVLETESGTVVSIYGLFNIGRTLENGFTIEACEKFSFGFPCWWENWNLLYPKMMSTQTGCQPRCSGTSNSRDNSSRFYLESFQKGKLFDSLGKLICNALDNAQASSGNGDAFPNTSCLPNGAPRFEEYTYDDTPTIEKSAASNRDSNEVENMVTDLIGANTLNEKSHNGIDSNVTSDSIVVYTNGEGNVGIDNASHINNGHLKAPVVLLKRQGCLKKPQLVASSESVLGEDSPPYSNVESSEKGVQHVGTSTNKRSAFGKLQHATRSQNSKRPIPYIRGNLSPLTYGRGKSLSVFTPGSLKLKKTRSGRVVVPALDPGCQSIIYDHDGSISAIIGLDSPSQLKGSTSKNYARKKRRAN